METETGQPPLLLVDESVSARFVTGGALWLPSTVLDAAVIELARLKRERGIAADAEIHCRVLFHGDARARSPFKDLTVDDCTELLNACVTAINGLGGLWFGAWLDRDAYPVELQMVGGERFGVEAKHLAGLAVYAAIVRAQHQVGSSYRLGFDPDPTKIDWGLAARVQATHFSRTHPQAVVLSVDEQRLLQMADVAAYAVGQSLLAELRPADRKARHFPGLVKLMNMRTGSFAYTPWLNPSTWGSSPVAI